MPRTKARYIAAHGSADCSTSTIGKRPDRCYPKILDITGTLNFCYRKAA